jgi:ElaB/YqjD/DUF883 family membrane-anchored ribosome-binding protein
MDRESPELIEREMECTRESLTEKVSLLENKVLGQVQNATDTVEGTMTSVQDTVETVKAAVQDTVQSVTDTVKHSVQSLTDGLKETFDVRRHTQENPWAMVGGAAVAGFLTGLVVFRRESTVSPGELPAYTPMPTALGAAAPPVSHRPQWLSDILEMAGREVKQIAQQAIAQASSSLRQTVQSRVPQLVEQVVPGGQAGAACATDGTTGTYGNGASQQFGGGMRR